MKKVITIFFLLSVLSCKDKRKTGELLPTFNILLTDSTTRFKTSNIQKGLPIVLLYFSPDCEHCQQETKSIITHMNNLKNVRFYLVTNEPFGEMKTFNAIFNLQQYSNITVGQDYQFFMIRHFKGILPPCLIIYDKELHQRAQLNGSKTPEELITLISTL